MAAMVSSSSARHGDCCRLPMRFVPIRLSIANGWLARFQRRWLCPYCLRATHGVVGRRLAWSRSAAELVSHRQALVMTAIIMSIRKPRSSMVQRHPVPGPSRYHSPDLRARLDPPEPQDLLGRPVPMGFQDLPDHKVQRVWQARPGAPVAVHRPARMPTAICT